MGTTQTDINGFYEFATVADGTYTLIACAFVDNISLVHVRPNVIPPNPLANLYMLPGICTP